MSKQKIKIKLKDIKTVGKRTTKSIFYSWRRLRKSIKTQGYKPENFSYILVYKHEEKYNVINGNHRVKVLEEIYGEDYEVEVICQDKPKTALKDLYSRMIKPLFSSNQKKIIKIINFILFAIIIWYFFIDNFLATVMLGIISWLTIIYFPENTYSLPVYYEGDPDKKKWRDRFPYLYTIWLNLYKNMRVIILMLTVLGYIIYIAYGGFIKMVICMSLTALFMHLKQIKS